MASYPTMKLLLVALAGEKMNTEIYEVILPTIAGQISVFPDHESLVTLAKPGVIAVRHKKVDPDDAMELFAISGGVIEIDVKRVRVLVDEAEQSDEIVEEEAQKALDRAIKMRDNAGSEEELEEAADMIAMQNVRLRVAGLRRRQRTRM